MRRLVLMAMAVVAAMVCGATPFWYQNADPATNRTSVSATDAVGSAPLELRLISEGWSDTIMFTTYPLGLAVVIR